MKNDTFNKKLLEFLKDIDNGTHNDLNDILKTSYFLYDLIENCGYSVNDILTTIGGIIRNIDGDYIKNVKSIDMFKTEMHTIRFTHINDSNLEFNFNESVGLMKGINKIVSFEKFLNHCQKRENENE